MKKYILLLFSILTLLILGSTYTYSVFLESFTREFSITKSVASIPFSIFLLFYALGMGVAGKLYTVYSSKALGIFGGILFSIGFLTSSFAPNIVMVGISYGVLGGTGLSFGYVTAVSLVSEWFEERKGLASGIVISAFGLGSFFFSPLSSKLITQIGWRKTFLYESLAFFVILLVSALFFERPVSSTKKTKTISYSEILGSKIFKKLWVSYVLSLTTGLMIMGHIVPLSKEVGLTQGAVFISVIALFNALGRLIMGNLGDRFSPTSLLQKINMLQTFTFALFAMSYLYSPILYIAIPLFGFGFGGWLVLYPLLSAEHFGKEAMSTVYGALFSSYGIAGIIGPIFVSSLQENFGNYIPSLLLCILLCTTAVGIASFNKKAYSESHKQNA